jgi:uncharacterized protein (DUF362 family)
MKKISRREFLLAMAASMGAVAFDQFLTACEGEQATEIPSVTLQSTPTQLSDTRTPQPSNTPRSSTNPQSESPTELAPTQTQPAPSETPAGSPDLAVARGGEPEMLVQRALAAFGGMQTFVPKGANVVIKPNICVAYHTYEYAATTNPWVVGALVKLCFEAGAASVKVMDYPFGGTIQEAYQISGIAEQVKAAGGEMDFMPGFKYVDTDIPNGVKLKKTMVYDDVLKADVLINVPIPKHHSLAGLTLGMKNLMGVIRDREQMHSDLGQKLTDLAGRIRPTLTVVDAVRILRAHGPTGGSLDDVQKLDTVIVSQDIIAADSYAAGLLDKRPEEISYIKVGAQSGLGRSDLANLRIEEIRVDG